MDVVLLIFILTTKSSYLENRSEPADTAFDTVQWFISRDDFSRIRTFALDEDVHIGVISNELGFERNYQLALENTEKNYHDIVARLVTVRSSDGLKGLISSLSESGMSGQLHAFGGSQAFWTPAGTSYRTRSRPAEED